MSDDDSELEPRQRRKRKIRYIEDSSSDSSIEFRKRNRANARNYISDTDSDSDSGSSIICFLRRKRVGKVQSDSSASDESDRGFESSSSEWGTEFSDKLSKTDQGAAALSDSSDNDAEKCPICLLSFKKQQVGIPKSCEHTFCADCIQEWSRNVNTCPVDRLPFDLIVIRERYNGKILKEIRVEPQASQNEPTIYEDPTYCEVCGSSENEDRMLLCDDCDLGYHLECLNPPLADVPAGAWYCDRCALQELEEYEVQLLLDEADAFGWQEGRRTRRRATSPRQIPRTRQSERVRQQIARQRRATLTPRAESSSTALTPEDADLQPSTSVLRTQTPRTKKRKVKRRRKKKQPLYKIVYKIDESTGETVPVKKRRKRRKKRKRPRLASSSKPSTVKKRLAKQLGICSVQNTRNHLPDVRSSRSADNVGNRGVRVVSMLQLFGERDTLEYFSDSEMEYGGPNFLVRRRPTTSDAAVLNRRVRQKSVVIPQAAIATQNNLLSTILESQSKLYSKLNANNNSVPKKETPMFPDKENNANSAVQSFSAENETNSRGSEYNNYGYEATSTEGAGSNSGIGEEEFEGPRDYSQAGLYRMYDQEDKDKKDEEKASASEENSPSNSDSEVDIYSDIETVSTSKAEENEGKGEIPVSSQLQIVAGTDEENNENSDNELIIDTENLEKNEESAENLKDETVSSTVDSDYVPSMSDRKSGAAHSTTEIQSGTIQSTSQSGYHPAEVDEDKDIEEEEDYQDGCPNFSIYSTESINFAKSTEMELLSGTDERVACGEVSSTPINKSPTKVAGTLYSDSEDDNIKIDLPRSFQIGDIRNMTEDISEEERSYTPCLDERMVLNQENFGGLDTEMISDEDRNDFDEAQELKTISDGDALEINAKESELDFTKPEDFEEGEIVDVNKMARIESEKKEKAEEKEHKENENQKKKTVATKQAEMNKKSGGDNRTTAFKKLSKSTKDRNYRDKEDKSRDRDSRGNKENKKKKEKRKEIVRYNVRAIIADKPKKTKDKFGRDIKRSTSCSSRSLTPPPIQRSPLRTRRSSSRDKSKKKRSRSRGRSSYSRSKSPERRRKKRRRSPTNESRKKHKRSRSRKRKRSRSRSGSSPRRHEWTEQRSFRSWTPSRTVDKPVNPHNLTVILTNDKKKKDKRKKSEKRKEGKEKNKWKRSERTSPPSKEVFTSGDNILVSVSFNKDNDSRDITNTTKRKKEPVVAEKKQKKEKKKPAKKDLSGVKPVAIIDLDRSPFKELTPSPKNIIVLSDSENGESNDLLGLQKAICDSSQQAATPERGVNYSTGPKTPPEPQVKFTLAAKPPQIRPISNPLHDPEEVESDIDAQEELEQQLNEVLHKGPNTPPEPPNSPPSSPDAYDPFDPTRSPTPHQAQSQTQSNSPVASEHQEDSLMERSGETEKSASPVAKTPENSKSHTPPLPDGQLDSQNSVVVVNSPDQNSTQPAERNIGVVINQVVQQPSAMFPSAVSKLVPPAIPYSSSSQSLITSTPISISSTVPRINIMNSTILTPSALNSNTVQQRIGVPTPTKTSPVKTPQAKPPLKTSPAKPTPSKVSQNVTKPGRKSSRSQNGSDEVNTLDLDSPYSPGSSDYEDLFEPPPETGKIIGANVKPPLAKTSKAPPKVQNAFDALFGSSPVYKNKNKPPDKTKNTKKGTISPAKSKGTKLVGVKLDEDNLRILDELPNSAVEMQVKDKFLKKLNRQERVVEEVKLVLKPHYNKKRINKEEYKDILRRAVPKICHNRSGEINPHKIKNLIEAYVKKIKHSKKVTSSSSVNPQKM